MMEKLLKELALAGFKTVKNNKEHFTNEDKEVLGKYYKDIGVFIVMRDEYPQVHIHDALDSHVNNTFSYKNNLEEILKNYKDR